ncbi:TrpB-like pyridoxal phosphate-dependent enzyme [Streptomyces sp. SID8352]|uniref:TrpB-like pyridoxal phosphate-dependent enzyme n=1 Tax=unclassified Streptomyces TaxID=2593676 RepID=UPI00136CDEE3|nr:TrpB-like pyridoxal phosphate-dependent enzyme [Streptomyces sp. SID8352]MYU22656.1 TrpB-like pyridoxal phosphate-dependent enzyme [Streptomyces sp. SID8352]
MPDTTTTRYLLGERDIPRAWHNLAADLGGLAPPVHPVTGRPVTADDLLAIMPPELARQETSREAEIEIPWQIRRAYAQWRPTPLFRARRLERALGTPARIYYKYEGCSPTGSHKANTAVAQAFYNQQAGIRRLVTDTGAGQWGSSLAYAGALFGLAVQVFMVRVSYQHKPHRRTFMEAYGARCVPSPSPETAAGRAVLAADPDCEGSLGIAISEAAELALSDPATSFASGSVLNHVLLHQSVIGKEAVAQLALADDHPDVLIGCVGGGSNLGGLIAPFLHPAAGPPPRIIAVEPTACPTLTRGRIAYDFADSAGLTPMLRMHTLGHTYMPPALHAGGLRYHGIAPLLSAAHERGLVEALSLPQTECLAAGLRFARTEGIVPAPESSHAIAAVVREALRCKEAGRAESILFGLSGHGHFDLTAYENHLADRLHDQPLDENALAASFARLPAAALVQD